MNFKCLEDLKSFLVSAHESTTQIPAGWSISAEMCPAGMEGDITINCFRFAKLFGSNPDTIATETESFLSSHPDVISAKKAKAFVNVSLKAAPLFRDTLADRNAYFDAVALPESQRRKILVEYSAPNTNKPQHLGHVRNNTLGMALCAVLKRAGHTPVPVNLINDRGIHICKSMIAYQRFGNGDTPLKSGVKGDHFVGNYYVKYNSVFREQVEQLKAEKPELKDKDSEELFLDTEIGFAAQKMLRDWEAGDAETITLWELMNSWVIEGFNQTYERMGVKFEKTYLESQTYLLGKDLIAENLKKGVFEQREDGATVVDLGKLGKKVVLRSDGTSVYITQDIGTTMLKFDEFHPESMVWVVGDEQILHFQMLFAILKKMGYAWADKLFHLAYGMVNLPTGKMKSREGTVVDADDLFDEMHALAKTAALERVGEGEIPADLEERAEMIGMGALKFMLLKFNPKTTMMFDPQASVKFEGDTGPYVQYVCARINSIARKAAERNFDCGKTADWSLLDSVEEKSLAVFASLYPDAIQNAAEKMDCSVLVNYLLDLAKLFNRFYREKQVLNAEDDTVRSVRLALCFMIRDILTDGLAALTIRAPETM